MLPENMDDEIEDGANLAKRRYAGVDRLLEGGRRGISSCCTSMLTGQSGEWVSRQSPSKGEQRERREAEIP